MSDVATLYLGHCVFIVFIFCEGLSVCSLSVFFCFFVVLFSFSVFVARAILLCLFAVLIIFVCLCLRFFLSTADSPSPSPSMSPSPSPSPSPCPACNAAAGETECGVWPASCYCAVLATDEQYCGNCSTTCAAGLECWQGQCVPVADIVCPVLNQTYCPSASACVDVLYDAAHCGRCGNRCGPGAECIAGGCGYTFANDTDREVCAAGPGSGGLECVVWGKPRGNLRSGRVLPATTARQPRYQASDGRTSGRNAHAQRPREGASRWRSCLTRTGLELGDLGWQWYLCLIRIAPSPGRSAPYWLVPGMGARSGPSDSSAGSPKETTGKRHCKLRG